MSQLAMGGGGGLVTVRYGAPCRLRSDIAGNFRNSSDMQASVIVFLETVPDLCGVAAANDLIGKSDVEVREAIGEKVQSTSITPSSASER
jgi:hypothetical protein